MLFFLQSSKTCFTPFRRIFPTSLFLPSFLHLTLIKEKWDLDVIFLVFCSLYRGGQKKQPERKTNYDQFQPMFTSFDLFEPISSELDQYRPTATDRVFTSTYAFGPIPTDLVPFRLTNCTSGASTFFCLFSYKKDGID